ncbi:MAG: hypothetical protein FKY71_10880 [Spiribacter salinus]|uniref:Uncharacterized protein n=1 Tax=Spiribacter salinus TaxID=1335746 RepID=A0A540VQF8_9GAMM|nr:MAG: hypothetical protein FKY71_10880 [Spiribacter salinus]
MSTTDKGPALKDIDWEAEAAKASRQYLKERQQDRDNTYRLEDPADNIAGIRQQLDPLEYHPKMTTARKAQLAEELGVEEYRRQRTEYNRRSR